MDERRKGMKYNFSVPTYKGIKNYHFPATKVGELELNCMNHVDSGVNSLICLFFSEKCSSHNIHTVEDLFDYERRWNINMQGEPICGYSATLESGAQMTAKQIRSRFSYIWYSFMFSEVRLDDFDFYQLLRMRSFMDSIRRSEDPEEALFWSFVLCAWGVYENYLPFTLYKFIVDGRYQRFLEDHSEWKGILY